MGGAIQSIIVAPIPSLLVLIGWPLLWIGLPALVGMAVYAAIGLAIILGGFALMVAARFFLGTEF